MSIRRLNEYNEPYITDPEDLSVDWFLGAVETTNFQSAAIVWSLAEMGLHDGDVVRVFGTIHVTDRSAGCRFALIENPMGATEVTDIATIEDGTTEVDYTFTVDLSSDDPRPYIRLYGNAYRRTIDFGNIYLDGVPAKDDPYEEGGTSGMGGGTGTFSGTGDLIAIPDLPTLSAVDAGFITLFNPSITQLGALASYMWSNPLFDLDAWRKIFADPMQAILGLSIVPVNVPSAGAKNVTVGNISTGISMTVASSQYVAVDCGTLNVQEFWGAYLDYDPYTKAEIYLPYIGTHALAVDDIMGKSVHVVYHVDVLSGACCAYVQCGGTVLYTFIGQCASSIPITGDNWTNVINGAISIAGSIGSMVATGGVSAPMEIGNIASTAVNTMKPSIEKSGAMGGTGGMMGVQTPYLILTRPRQALPARQNTFTGYPSFITEELSTLSGYTEVFKIHLENVPATEQELAEIETLLKSGVIF